MSNYFLIGQVSPEDCLNAIYNNQSSLSVKKIIAKEGEFDERPTFNFPGDVKKSNVALSGITRRYLDKRRDDAIANTMLRTTFDVVAGSLTLASYGTGPMAPIVASGVHYVSSKTLDYVADMARESMKLSSGKVLKAGLKSYLDEHGVENLRDKEPAEIVATLDDNGYLPGIEIDDNLDENGKSILMGAMINELARTDEITLRQLAQQGEEINEIQQDVTNLKAMGQSMWNTIDANNQRITRVAENMTKIRDNLQNQITLNKQDILANRSDIEYLQNFMYGKMSAQERRDAINNGFFPNMDPAKRAKLEQQLEMEAAREEIIADMGQYLNSAGDILNIASNFGFKSDLLDDAGKLVQAGSHILNGVTALSSPMGWLSAASSFSNVLSIGKPDAGATHHKQIMKTLGKILENQQLMLEKLQRIERNQVQILENQKRIYDAIVALSNQVQDNHNELLEKLSEIQEDVLVNREGIAELVRREYKVCFEPISDITSPFESLTYDELKDFYAKWSRPISNNILPCIEGLNNTISFGNGTASTAFNAEFDVYKNKDEIKEFINGYWKNQIEVLEDILENDDIDFLQFFLMSINPNLLVDNVDKVYSKDMQYIILDRLKRFTQSNDVDELDFFTKNKVNLIRKYYSTEATFEIINLFKKYLIFYELISSDPRSLKDIEMLSGYDEFDNTLSIRLENAILRLDILILQQNLIIGSPLLPYYYKILFEEQDNKDLKMNVFSLIRNNPRLKANLISYIIKKELKRNNSSYSQYHFALNLKSPEDPWLLRSTLGELPGTEFVWKDTDYLESNGYKKDLHWFLKIKFERLNNDGEQITDEIYIQLPKLEEVKTGHLYFTNEIFEAIELRNTLLDYYYGLNIQDEFLDSEKQILFETLIYSQ